MKKTLIISLFFLFTLITFAQVSKSDLHEACKVGNTIIVGQYIAEGSDINIFFENGETALMTGCNQNLARIIKQVVSSGAELNLVNNDGMTAMTLLRLQMGFNDTYNSESQTNLREMYGYLKSKGGKEEDYVQLIADNKDGAFNEEQKIVVQIKKDFKAYMSNSKSYKTKTYKEHKHEGDDITFTDLKNDYVAKYDESGKLVFFQHKSISIAEWHDNGSQDGFDRQYYFKNGKLYFYFDTNYSGPVEHNYQQFRYYFHNDKIVIAAVKRYDEWWENMKEEKDKLSFKNIVNTKVIDNYHKPDEKAKRLLEEFNKSYTGIKHLLK